MYDEGAPSCELYREMQEASETEVNEEAEWKKRLPALYYTQGPTVYTLNDVPLTVSLKGEGSRLTCVLPTRTPCHPSCTHHAPPHHHHRTTTTAPPPPHHRTHAPPHQRTPQVRNPNPNPNSGT